MYYRQRTQDDTLGRIGAGIIGILLIAPLLGIPEFLFRGITFDGTIMNKIWYIVLKLTILILMYICGYIAIKGSEWTNATTAKKKEEEEEQQERDGYAKHVKNTA